MKMAAGYDSRIVNQYLQPLSHLTTVGVTLPLLNDFGPKMLEKAFLEIQPGNSAAVIKGGNLQTDLERAKEKLRCIPPLLRKSVLQAANGLKREVDLMQSEHTYIFKYKDGDSFFHWKSDGTLDIFKIAQQLVFDQSIDIKKRFEIACRYFLEDSVKVLWAEIKASGKNMNHNNISNIMVRFWVRWLQEGSRVPWTQAAAEYFELPVHYSRLKFSRYRCFFPSLPPEEREKFLIPLQSATENDFLSCFYSMTKEEQEEILRKGFCAIVLIYHLKWPLQNFFLQIAEKLQRFMNANSFCLLIQHLLTLDYKRDFDYREIFRELWNRTPDNMKEVVKKNRYLMEKVNSWIKEIKIKEIVHNENRNLKRKVSSNTKRKNKRVKKK